MQQQLLAILPMVLVFVVFYFFMIRPQRKRERERNLMLSNLRRGDKVVTIGGLHGSVIDLKEDQVTLKVSDNTRLVFERSAVNAVLGNDKAKDKEKEKDKEKKDD